MSASPLWTPFLDPTSSARGSNVWCINSRPLTVTPTTQTCIRFGQGLHIPDLDGAAGDGYQPGSVRGVGEPDEWIGVSAQSCGVAVGGEVADTDHLVLTDVGEEPAVGTEGHPVAVRHGPGSDFLPPSQIPNV